MTTLDQAFIKAFTRQDTSPLPITPLPAAQGTKQSSLNWERDRSEADNEDLPLPAEVTSLPSPMVQSSSFVALAEPFQTAGPSPSAVSESVLAALEKPPKAVTSHLKAASQSRESGQKDEQEEERDAANEQVTESPRENVWSESNSETVEPTSRDIDGPQTPISDLPGSLPPAESPPMGHKFEPAWQVDHFTWPRVCRRLIARAAEELDRFADALLALNAQGQKVLAIGGCHRGEGATTLLLCAARRLAERGIKIVLVDADLDRPRLAKRLAVEPQFGWDETVDTDGPLLDQAIVEATANNLALLPARGSPTDSGQHTSDPSRLSACLRTLRDHYDLVLVDSGPLDDAWSADGVLAPNAVEMIDAVVLVHNPRITSEDQLLAFEQQLATVGIAAAGIVENFVAE